MSEERRGATWHICQSCGNKETKQLHGIDAAEYAAHHGSSQFKAYRCPCCRSQWHWSLPHVKGTQ